MKRTLSIQEQIDIIQRTMSNPDFFDEVQLIEHGIKPYRNSHTTYKDHYEFHQKLEEKRDIFSDEEV